MPKSESWSEPLVVKLIERHHGTEPEQILDHAEALLNESEQESASRRRGSHRLEFSAYAVVSSLPYAGRIYAEPSGQLVNGP